MLPLIEDKFERMGARVSIHAPVRPRWSTDSRPVVLNIARDRRGELFDVAVDLRRVSLDVVDVRPNMRHLLLMSRNVDDGRKEKFLCGHDERAWFVAAIPPGSASNVVTAMEALKPWIVQDEQARLGVRLKERLTRRTEAYIRQGEWFFVPAPGMVVPDVLVLKNEPIRRGPSKAHWVQYVYRANGETVFVCDDYPNGLTESEYRSLIHRRPKAKNFGWRTMSRNAEVFAKGSVSHPDHATIYLNGWHRVAMNTESQAPAMRHVAFLD